MDTKIKAVLANFGFVEKEIKVYLSLLKEGELSALQLSKQAQIDRTTTYDVIQRLGEKGIVSSLLKNGTRHFKAISPKELLVHFKEKYENLAYILPELSKIRNQTKEEITCALFQGKEGLKTVAKDIITANKDYKVVGMQKEYDEILSYLTEQAIKKLDDTNVLETAIVEKSAKFKKRKNGRYRFVNKKLLSKVTTLLYAETVVFFLWKEPYFAIRIQHKEFAKAQEEYFDLLWNVAEEM